MFSYRNTLVLFGWLELPLLAGGDAAHTEVRHYLAYAIIAHQIRKD